MREDLDINYFKQKLEQELALVEQELKDVGRKNPDNKADWEGKPSDVADSADDNETADKIEEYEENTAIVKDLEVRYNDIKDALLKIEKGVYGICEMSGEPIEKDRLEANQAARTCKKHMNVG
ncbi:MAG: TraR/DksA C4-type zinc finger protein [Patescibacteria group bacterium]